MLAAPLFLLGCGAPAGFKFVTYEDADGDGVSAEVDCDDENAAINLDAVEMCDSVDNNCDGIIDTDAADMETWYADTDGDGYGYGAPILACDAPADALADDSDCDDENPAVNPAAVEVCDTLDNNCDGVIDTDATDMATWYGDTDGDGYGDATAYTVACDAPANTIADATDCDDTDGTVFPGAVEPCGGSDLDCDLSEPELCTSCTEALADGYTSDGLVLIDVDGLGGAVPEVEVWCDQSTDGGGWTLIQRSVWDWADTSLLWTDYADWYGIHQGNAAVGEAFRLAGMAWTTVGARGELLGILQARDSSSLTDCDPLYYTASGGTISISATAADLGALSGVVPLTNAPQLSTTDSGPSSTCVSDYGAVPWFYSTCCTTCPTFFGSYWSDEPHPMASYVDAQPDINGLTTANTCPSGAALPANQASYEGINVMEFYLR